VGRTEEFMLQRQDSWETECPKSNDRQHCDCWYDGKPCCRCGVAMNFGDAMTALKNDPGVTRVCRSGWNGKGMWLCLQVPDAHSKMTKPYVYLSTVDGNLVPWNPNNLDMLAEDWEICD
jgi:hypothetical protein